MRMPFERLMEQVAALGGEDGALTLGALSERWGEPAGRIGDAIDAVRVMRGERTYLSVRPEPEPEREPCRGFRWIGQPLTSCDGCGRPAWEHEGIEKLRDGAGPFGGEQDWEVRPWAPGFAEALRRKLGSPVPPARRREIDNEGEGRHG